MEINFLQHRERGPIRSLPLILYNIYFFSPAEVLIKEFSRSKTTLSLHLCCGEFSSTRSTQRDILISTAFCSLPSQNVRNYESSTKFVLVRPYPRSVLGIVPPHDWLYFNISIKYTTFKKFFSPNPTGLFYSIFL